MCNTKRKKWGTKPVTFVILSVLNNTMLPTPPLFSIDSGVALQADGASFSPEGTRETLKTYVLSWVQM